MADMQMPASPGTGSEPVPYTGPDLRPEPPPYSVDLPGDAGGVTTWIVADYPAGSPVTEAGYAHDIASAVVAPYVAGSPQAIHVGGDADAGGRDIVSGTVAGAVAAREAWFTEMQGDTLTAGGTIGDLMTLPHSPYGPSTGAVGEPPFEAPYIPETNPA